MTLNTQESLSLPRDNNPDRCAREGNWSGTSKQYIIVEGKQQAPRWRHWRRPAHGAGPENVLESYMFRLLPHYPECTVRSKRCHGGRVVLRPGVPGKPHAGDGQQAQGWCSSVSFQLAHALRPLPPRSLRNLGGPPHFEKASGGTTTSILNVLDVGAGSMLTAR